VTETPEIIRIAARGDGVTADGRHVALSAPGDRLNAEGGLIHGPHHITPPCRHFPICGGCQLQHVDEMSLAQFVRDRVVHALDGQGLTAEEIMPVHVSPPSTRRRISLRSHRAGKQLQLGFNTEKSYRVIDLQQCDVMKPKLFAMIEPLRQFLAPRLNPKANVQIKMAEIDQGVDLLIDGWMPDGLVDSEALLGFAAQHGLARLSLDDGYGATAFWEPEPATITLSGRAVGYPPHGFLQATRDGEDALTQAVKSIVGEAKLVADLFCGLGTFTLALAGKSKVYAAEAEAVAILALKSAIGSAPQLPVFTEHRDLFRRPLIASELNKFGAVILDPPRAGAREQVTHLANSTVEKIAYISCNPASFARDAKTLVETGYRIGRVWPVGQFRWSTHVELAAEFMR
jgi:23S rRNA (uracil1939-C5)-methyltransferase